MVEICVNVSIASIIWIGAVATLIVAMLRWLLTPKYRGVGKRFYDVQRRFMLTGCASGMGRHLTGCLLKRGHKVLATDLSSDALEKASKEEGWETLGGEIELRALDVTKRADWEIGLKFVEDKWSGLDVLMNIAGVLIPKRIQDAKARDIDLHVDVMVKGPAHGTQLAAQMMARKKIRGHIVNVSSMAAVAPVSGVTLYATAKYGCRGFSLAAAKDLAPLGIAVTAFMPDATQTPMVDLQLRYEGGAYAYSGKILGLDDIERSMLQHVLPDRPVEVWLSPRRSVVGCCGIGGMLAGVIHSSRLVMYEERRMLEAGKKRQRIILASDKEKGA